MTSNLRINTAYAMIKAREAVTNWEKALAIQVEQGNPEGIKVCEHAIKACKANVAKTREYIRNNWTNFL